MEMLVSVMLITLIVLFMYNAIGSMKLSNEGLKRHAKNEQRRDELYRLLYQDILRAADIEIIPTKNKKFTLLKLQTDNTLYQIARPHVLYYVHSRDQKLIRLESAHEIILPVTFESENGIYADTVINQVESFTVMASQQNVEDSNSSDTNATDQNRTSEIPLSRYLLYINAKTLPTPMLFEIAI